MRVFLGVILASHPDHIEVRPRPNRKQGLKQMILTALQCRNLSATEAEHLAGKLNFYNLAVFARLGRAIDFGRRPISMNSMTSKL